MELTARERLYQEQRTWLNRGRGKMIEVLLAGTRPTAGDVMEVGAGIGLYVDLMARYGPLDVVEIHGDTCDHLASLPAVRRTFREGLPDLKVDTRYKLIGAFDVLEHIVDDRAAMKWIDDHLEDNGVFVATVPAYQWLFSDHDVANEHFRRYTAGSLRRVIPDGLVIERITYFNSALFPVAVAARAVWQTCRALTRESSSDGRTEKQSSAIPGFADRIFFAIMRAEAWAVARGIYLPFGLSISVVARKRAPVASDAPPVTTPD